MVQGLDESRFDREAKLWGPAGPRTSSIRFCACSSTTTDSVRPFSRWAGW